MKTRPNLLFLLSDDQGAWALGCAGNKEIQTPALDSIAENGMRFDDFYCVSPVCSPARASILSGTIPSVHGVQDWLRGGNLNMAEFPELQGDPLYASEHTAIPYLQNMTCFTDVLAENGYVCALSGKWHLGDSIHPQHGFSRWFTIARGGCAYYHPDLVLDGQVVQSDRYITDLITEDALKNLQDFSESEDPFCLCVHYTAPHAPWSPEHHPKEFLDLYRDCPFESTPDEPLHPWLSPAAPYKPGAEGRRESLTGYYAAISAMDAGIGKILAKLRETGLDQDTLVIFTSDNGMNMGHHGIWGKGNGTYPQNMYDSSVKVPFLASWPGHIPANTVSRQMLSHYDVFPTLMDCFGLTANTRQPLPGHSFAEVLGGKTQEEKPVVIFDEYGPVRMIRTRRWKYVARIPSGPDELYDMINDPGEKNNRIHDPALADVRCRLRSELQIWFAKWVDPAIDGSHELNTGYGQLCRPGVYSEGKPVFAEEDSFRKASEQATNELKLETGEQP